VLLFVRESSLPPVLNESAPTIPAGERTRAGHVAAERVLVSVVAAVPELMVPVLPPVTPGIRRKE
jgi:hypothetical protein